MILRNLLKFSLILLLLIPGCKHQEDAAPKVFADIDLNAFAKAHKGFNLLGKFDVTWSNTGFPEEEFIIASDLGFNFVRLPLDYRTYTKTGDWSAFLEDQVAQIDQAVAFGKKYGVHVCICLHRAPGYCVNSETLPANQNLDLWTNSTAQEAFVNHWAFFANRYKNESYQDVSFNLVNEPTDMDEAVYVGVMKKAIDKIQSINPDRIIFVDGLGYGRKLIESLKNTKDVIQAIHAYDPMTLTHYKAEWVEGSDAWPVPVWPVSGISNFLFGPGKSEFQSSLVFEGNFAKDTQITINVNQVSVQSTLQVNLNDTPILNKVFTCGPDLGTDWTQIINTQWGYQNISNKDYTATLPADGTRLTISNTAGDWMNFNSITITSGSSVISIIPGNTTWGAKQDTYKITADGKVTDKDGNPSLVFGDLVSRLETAKTEGIPVMIQEFGVYNKTPHDVTLSFVSDLVSIFHRYQLGYAMWNMIGTMGIIDSGRTDCAYESYRGKQLDRQMTTIMQGTD